MDGASTTLLVATLFPMMIAKFAIVCGWFMHLRYDNPLFRRIFVFGLTAGGRGVPDHADRHELLVVELRMTLVVT